MVFIFSLLRYWKIFYVDFFKGIMSQDFPHFIASEHYTWICSSVCLSIYVLTCRASYLVSCLSAPLTVLLPASTCLSVAGP